MTSGAFRTFGLAALLLAGTAISAVSAAPSTDQLYELDDCLAKAAATQPVGRPQSRLIEDFASACRLETSVVYWAFRNSGENDEEARLHLTIDHFAAPLARARGNYRAIVAEPPASSPICTDRPMECLRQAVAKARADLLKKEADEAAKKAQRAAAQPGPKEVPLCAGRMTRDGCQPR